MSATPVSPLPRDPGFPDGAAQGTATGVRAFLSSLFWVYSPSHKRRRIFPGWWEVLAGTIHSFFGYGFYLYSWSVIVGAMAKEFQWSATVISVTGSLGREEGAIEGPIVGWLTDKFGPKPTAAGGWLIGGIGYLLLPLIFVVNGASWWMWVCYGLLVQLGMNSALYNTSYKAVNRWFIKNRGLAIGLNATGAGFGSPILIPVTAFLTVTFGWRAAVVFIGAVFILMGLTTSLTLFRRHGPEHLGMFPDNTPLTPVPTAAAAAEAKPTTALKEFSVREALKDRSFWLWTMSGIILNLGAASTALPIFQNIRLREVGVSVETAALWYALDFLFTAVGRTGCALTNDWLADHGLRPWHTLGIVYIIEGIGFYCFGVASSVWWLLGYAMFHGFGYGYSIPNAGIVPGALFGREKYGTIRGLNLFLTSLLTLPGPILFGYLRDVTGDYYLPFAIGGGLAYALGGFMMFLCRTPKGQIEPGRRVRVVSGH